MCHPDRHLGSRSLNGDAARGEKCCHTQEPPQIIQFSVCYADNDTLVDNVSMSTLPKFNRGVTVLAVLSALDRRETYGYEIRREAFRRTKGLFTVNEGALYPLLHSLVRKQLVRMRQQKVGGRWRKYYRLTERGRKELSVMRHDWNGSLKVLKALLG